MKADKTNPLDDSGTSGTDWLIDLDGPCDPSELVKLSGAVSDRDGVTAEHEWTRFDWLAFEVPAKNEASARNGLAQ
jgi:hypothetical protein